LPELRFTRKSGHSSEIRSSSANFSAAESEIVRRLVGHSIAEVECELICETLRAQRGSRTRASKLLDISIRALRNKIREYKACGRTVPEPSKSFHQYDLDPDEKLH
jgi:DNA-binding NtrC family response regulator